MSMSQVNGNHQAPQARWEDLVIQEMPDEVLVYDLKGHKAHMLNQTAAFVWNHCDGETTPKEMAALMEQEWSKPVSEDVVWLALKQLSKANLLQEPIAMPDNGTRVSRRQAMRRLGIAAMVPLVISIVAPTAMAGASIPPICQSCVNKSSGAADCPNVCTGLGTCYGNAGCGAGQACDCRTCASCFSNECSCFNPGLNCRDGSVSWVAPGPTC
jgi:hypothetical protein